MNQESASIIPGSEQWVETFPAEMYDDARDVVQESVERDIDAVDPINRKLLWSDGDQLSFDETVKKISAGNQQFPAVLIQSHLVAWLEQGELPGELTDKEMDELDTQMEPWLDELEAIKYRSPES